MPAQSKQQQKFMGMVHALKKGDMKPSDASPELKKAAQSMSDKDAKDFASTSHKGLPKKVKQEILNKLKEYANSMGRDHLGGDDYTSSKKGGLRDFDGYDNVDYNRDMPMDEGFKSEYKGNDGIIWKKGKTQGGVTNFTPYYKGHNIDFGGRNFKTEKELKDFIKDYILSIQLYNKYRFEGKLPNNWMQGRVSDYHTSLRGKKKDYSGGTNFRKDNSGQPDLEDEKTEGIHSYPAMSATRAALKRKKRKEGVNEVGTNDWHFKAIKKLWDKAGSFTRKKIAGLITKNPNSNWSKIENYLKGSDYNDVTYYTDMLHLEGVVNKLKSINEAQAVSGGKIHKFITGKNITLKGKKHSDVDFELISIDNKTQLVKLKVIGPKELFGHEITIDFRTLRRGPFIKTDTSKIKEYASNQTLSYLPADEEEIEKMNETMIRRASDIAQKLIPMDTWSRHASFQDGGKKNKEFVKNIVRDLAQSLNRFYKSHDINVRIQENEGDSNVDMVLGVLSILRQIDDKENRKRVAVDMIKKFKEQDIDFDYQEFVDLMKEYSMGSYEYNK